MFRLILVILIIVSSVMVYQNVKKPNLGVENGLFKPLGKRPNSVSSQAAIKSKKVAVISFEGEVAEQMDRIEDIVVSMPGAKIHQKQGSYLYAIFTSSLMRYKDDVEIFLDDSKKEVHFRSASRVGYSDMGVNRKRYNAFALSYQEAN